MLTAAKNAISQQAITRPLVYHGTRAASSVSQLTQEIKAQPSKQYEHPVSLNFEDVKVFERKPVFELSKSLAIQGLCKIKPLVQNANLLIAASRKVLPNSLIDVGLKHTFFSHFCGGTNLAEAEKTIDRLKAQGVGSMLDYAAEADVGHNVPPEQMTAALNENCRNSISAVELSAKQEVGYTAVKMTSIVPPIVLLKASGIIHTARQSFFLLSNSREAAVDLNSTPTISKEDFISYFHDVFPSSTISSSGREEMFRTICNLSRDNPDDFSPLRFFEWMKAISPINVKKGTLLSEMLLGGGVGKYEAEMLLNDEELKEIESGFERVKNIAARAKELGNVKVMIDAEQTYMQPSIDWITLEVACMYNKEKATVLNTYQCYLKDADRRLVLDMEGAEKSGWKFGAKLVRGAYMFQERRLAKEKNYEDPIHTTLENTHACYDKCVEYLLRKHDLGFDAVLGTHNQQSVLKAFKLLQTYNIPINSPSFAIAQLLGMCDNITLAIAEKGGRAYKYVPYGPIRDVLPYLLRRAEENSDMLGSGGTEMKLMFRALKKKMTGA